MEMEILKILNWLQMAFLSNYRKFNLNLYKNKVVYLFNKYIHTYTHI